MSPDHYTHVIKRIYFPYPNLIPLPRVISQKMLMFFLQTFLCVYL